MDSSDHRTIAIAPLPAEDYLILGPFPAGSMLTDLMIVLSSSAAAVHTVSPVLVRSSDATLKNQQSGTPLMTRSEVQLNSVNATKIYQPANTAVTLEMKLDRGPQDGMTWILVAVSNGGAATLEAFANARAASRPM